MFSILLNGWSFVYLETPQGVRRKSLSWQSAYCVLCDTRFVSRPLIFQAGIKSIGHMPHALRYYHFRLILGKLSIAS